MELRLPLGRSLAVTSGDSEFRNIVLPSMGFFKPTSALSNPSDILVKLVEDLDYMKECKFSFRSFQSAVPCSKLPGSSGQDNIWLKLIYWSNEVYLVVERGGEPGDISINRRSLVVVGHYIDSEEWGPR